MVVLCWRRWVDHHHHCVGKKLRILSSAPGQIARDMQTRDLLWKRSKSDITYVHIIPVTCLDEMGVGT